MIAVRPTKQQPQPAEPDQCFRDAAREMHDLALAIRKLSREIRAEKPPSSG